jgi:hypothetical protein
MSYASEVVSKHGGYSILTVSLHNIMAVLATSLTPAASMKTVVALICVDFIPLKKRWQLTCSCAPDCTATVLQGTDTC